MMGGWQKQGLLWSRYSCDDEDANNCHRRLQWIDYTRKVDIFIELLQSHVHREQLVFQVFPNIFWVDRFIGVVIRQQLQLP